MSRRTELRQGPVRHLARWARAAAPTSRRGEAHEERRVPAQRPPLLALGGDPARSPRWSGTHATPGARTLRRMLRVREEESARRIEELEREVERYRQLLVQVEAAAPTSDRTVDPATGLAPIPSGYRGVQGLSPDSPLAVIKRLLLHEVYLQNLEYRRRRRGA